MHSETAVSAPPSDSASSSASVAPPLLEVSGVSRNFGATAALTDLEFSVAPGSLTVLLGAAGAGKTTTLRLIAGLDKPDSGEIRLSGKSMAGWEPKDRNMAMIFDNLALYPNKTGYQNIATPLIIRKEPENEIRRKVEEISKMLEISHILARLPKTMSGGERQRIALGRALIRTPNIFLLDEPLSSLDAKLRISLRAELRRMQRDHGYTFILATPDFHEAIAIADTVIMLQQGRATQSGAPQTLYDAPADKETARFIGAPQINLIPAAVENKHLVFGGIRIPLPDHLASVIPAGKRNPDLGIRPENLVLLPPEDAAGDPSAVESGHDASPDPPHILTRIADIEPLGPKAAVTVSDGESDEAVELRILVDAAAAVSLSPGQDVRVRVKDTARLLAFDPETSRRFGA